MPSRCVRGSGDAVFLQNLVLVQIEARFKRARLQLFHNNKRATLGTVPVAIALGHRWHAPRCIQRAAPWRELLLCAAESMIDLYTSAPVVSASSSAIKNTPKTNWGKHALGRNVRRSVSSSR